MHIGDVEQHQSMIAKADLVIDALLDTGFRGVARGEGAALIEAANRSGSFILAVDIPTGLQADTGAWDGPCIRASARVTMGLRNRGLVLFPGAEMTGALYVADIGYPQALLDAVPIATWLVTAAKVQALLQPRRPDTHKGTYGHVLIVGGSVGFTGAAVLSTMGAARGGAGLVTVAVSPAGYPLVASKVTEGMATPLADGGGALGTSAMAPIAEAVSLGELV